MKCAKCGGLLRIGVFQGIHSISCYICGDIDYPFLPPYIRLDSDEPEVKKIHKNEKYGHLDWPEIKRRWLTGETFPSIAAGLGMDSRALNFAFRYRFPDVKRSPYVHANVKSRNLPTMKAVFWLAKGE